MSKGFQYNLPEEYKHRFVSGIFDAITSDIPELLKEHELPMANGVGLFRWNYINRNLLQNLGTKLEIYQAKRGAWKFLVLYDSISEMTFTVISETNLVRLQVRQPKSLHYLEALASINPDEKQIEGQMRLVDFEPRDASILEELQLQLTHQFSGSIKKHIVIAFDYVGMLVTSVRALVLNPKLETIYSEDWSEYLGRVFLDNSVVQELNSDRHQVDELIVSLKTQDQLVGLRKEDKKKEVGQ